jgi:hypothetical protein
MKTSRLALLALAASLSACATISQQQFNPQAESIHTIALISVADPVEYRTTDYGSKAGLLGPIGGAAIASGAAKMTAALTQAVKESKFDYSRAMQAALTEQLTRAGYKVVTVSARRDGAKLLSDYSAVPSGGADALLDIEGLVVGYSSVSVYDGDLRPHVQVNARLVSAKTRAPLYSEQFLFGYHNAFMSATELPSDKQYYFKNFESLMDNKARAIEGLQRGTETIAAQIAQRLSAR